MMTLEQQIICPDEHSLKEAAHLLLDSFPEDKVFAFFGKMGAGKTTFIKAVCSALSVMDEVTSPTFNIVNEYRTIDAEKVYHMDLYRIKEITEVLDIGYEDYFFGGDYCFIEWPEKGQELLPERCVLVRIEEDPADHSRRIRMKPQ